MLSSEIRPSRLAASLDESLQSLDDKQTQAHLGQKVISGLMQNSFFFAG
jgi:hypothetical protein